MSTLEQKALYPKGFINPNGRMVSVQTMARALAVIRKDPFLEVTGWEWYSVPGHMIQREFRRGLDDRINRRCARSGQ